MCVISVIQKQMSFMLGRHGMFLELNEDVEDYEDLTEIMSNVQLNSNFLALAREVMKRTRTHKNIQVMFDHKHLKRIRFQQKYFYYSCEYVSWYLD